MKKEDYARLDYFDVWFPLLAPSSELLKWMKTRDWPSEQVRWKKFRERYIAEMNKTDARQAIKLLAELSRATQSAFAGARASELGLPSYQHPRRDETFYNTGLDRFPLLVMCTGLCAIAGTPSLWYEFGTGDNLLFTKEDFEDPAKSRLFNRLRNVPDAQLAHFTGMLRAACLCNPTDVQFPERDISVVTTTARPWWTTASAPTAPPAISLGVQNRTSAGPTAHWSIVVALTFPVAPILLYLGGFIVAQVLACRLFLDAVFYVVERYIVFRKLPVFVHQSELGRNLERLKGKLSQDISEQSILQKEPAVLSQREAAEKARVLKELQEKEIDGALSRIDISQLGVIRGIGPSTLYNLRSAGIHNALQLRQRSRYGYYGIPGIGASRGSDIHHKLSSWEAAAWQKASKVLPATAESKIAGEYAARRRELLNKLDSIGRKVNLIRAQISQSEAEQRQLHLPSFRDFLRRNF